MCLSMYLEKENTVNTINVNSQTSPAQLKTGEQLDSFISASGGARDPLCLVQISLIQHHGQSESSDSNKICGVVSSNNGARIFFPCPSIAIFLAQMSHVELPLLLPGVGTGPNLGNQLIP